jgi:hypothetical protein
MSKEAHGWQIARRLKALYAAIGSRLSRQGLQQIVPGSFLDIVAKQLLNT